MPQAGRGGGEPGRIVVTKRFPSEPFKEQEMAFLSTGTFVVKEDL